MHVLLEFRLFRRSMSVGSLGKAWALSDSAFLWRRLFLVLRLLALQFHQGLPFDDGAAKGKSRFLYELALYGP